MVHKRILLTGVVSSLFAIIMVLMGFMPQVAQARAIDLQLSRINTISYSPYQDVGIDLQALLDATTDLTDTDGDGLPDSVEWVMGTDPENPDSDFDRLDDFWEINNSLDPMNPDSNHDGLPDYYEVTGVASPDIDGDGIENAWDPDNDGDGVSDAVDLSPSVYFNVSELYHFDITTNGNPTYMTFQLIPSNKEHLKLFGQLWDWPDSDNQGAVQDWDNSKEDVMVFPILQLTVNDPPEQDDVIMNCITVDRNIVSIPLMPVHEYGDIVAFAGRMLYPTATPSSLTVDARLIWKVVVKNDLDSSTLGQDTLLVTYKDSFVLTGMTVEQSNGTDVGLFYSSDINQTVAANLLFAYQFLRNSESHVADMPDVLDSQGVDVIEELASFSHKDAALVSIENEMIPAALDSLPAGQNLPVITILEDSSTGLELSEFEAISSDNFSVNLTTKPVMTTKTLKTSWYNTSDRQAMQTSDVMVAISELGLSDNATYLLMTLMLYWNTGEQSLEGLGIPPSEPGDDYDLVPDVVADIIGGSLSGIEGLYCEGIGLAGLMAYQSLEFLQSKGWAITIGKESLGYLDKMGDLDNFKSWVKQCDRIEESSSLYKGMDAVLEGLDIVMLFIETGFAAYSVVAIAQMSNLSGLQVSNAILTVTMELLYNLTLYMIGAIPYVGWIIAMGIELSDMWGDWSDDFIAWIVDQMGNVNHTVTPDIEIVGDPWITIDDKDSNGVDVGDRIELRSNLKGNILGNEHYWTLVQNSVIYPYYNILFPAGSCSVLGFPYQREVVTDFGNQWFPITVPQLSENRTDGWRAREYESGAWIEPGIAMPNFPVYLQINAYYQLWYEWSYFSWCIFSWGWHYHDSKQSGQTEVGGFTVYVDVMPATISDFAQWRGIVPLDHDRDGLKDSEEIQSDPWVFDTDADGLSDKYEDDIGTDPMKYDTDQDGLLDKYEIWYGADPNNPDTDGDGLKDSLEVSGWVITFTYGGQEFTMRVTSDPFVPDSDSDGIDDAMEYWSDLNPRSSDTDGDGVEDVANPKYLETQLQLEWALNMEPPSGKILDIALDAEENLYILTDETEMEEDQIYKFDSDGTFVKSWGGFYDWLLQLISIDPVAEKIYVMRSYFIYESEPNGEEPFTAFIGAISYIRAVDVDKDGNIYVAQQGKYNPITASIMKFDANGTLDKSWGSFGIGPEQFQDLIDIAVDDTNGYLYVIDQRGTDTRIAKFTADGVYLGDLPDGYNYPKAIDVDSEGNIYVANSSNHEILKFNSDGMLLASMGEYGDEEGNLVLPSRITVSDNNNVYVVDKPSAVPLYRVQKFSQFAGGARPEIPDDVPDRDGDGLTNALETAGWDVTFTDATGTYTIHVTSDPLMADTDLDGLTDLQEYDLGTDPRDPDTDNDGLSDFAEWRGFSPQTNPRHFDSDGDGLPDGVEITYGSDPNTEDTDGEGLPDAQEFGLGSDPNKTDTDNDGLNDADEEANNSNLTSPDSDGDFVFDGEEVNLGTGVNNGDTDNDGLSDGIEIEVYNTDPLNDDSDDDGVDDGEEVEQRLNPLSSDTDNDGIPDGTELEQGTNPWMGDSDYDGVPDNEEMENVAPVVDAGPDATADQGITFTNSGSFTDSDTDNWYAGVDYGDGSDIRPVTLNADKTFALRHAYSAHGTYTVTVTVADDRGGVGSDNITVTVTKSPPAVPSITFFGAVALAVTLAGCAVWVLRRRRACYKA